MAGPPEKATWARSLGCDYRPLGRDVSRFIHDMRDAVTVRAAFSFAGFVRQEVVNQFREFPDLVKGKDLVVGAGLAFALSSVTQGLGVPYRYICFTPQLLPSSHHPFMAVYPQTLPAWCNRFSWTLARWTDRFNMTRLINLNRRHLGLPPLEDIWDHILGDRPLVAADAAVFPVPADVRKPWDQTGSLHPELTVPAHPDLERFLDKGEPPLFAGFGSMPPQSQARIYPMLIRAARALGRRLILYCPDKTHLPGSSAAADDVFFIGPYPHYAVFPRTAAVVHHGGAGTTATVAMSGVPHLIIPHILDQYYHGHRIYRAGLGAQPVWRVFLSEERLTRALASALEPAKRLKARRVAAAIDPGESLRRAVRVLTKDG